MKPDLTECSNIAKFAPKLFYFIGLPIAIWSEMFVPSRIFVTQDPIATTDNLLANEFIFRTSMFGHIAGNMLFVFMLLLFYRIFRSVDRHLALLMLVPALAQIPIVFISEVFNYTALMTIKTEARSTFDVAQKQEVSFFLMRMFRYGMGATKFFFGLSFIPFGMLILRSGFAPRIIGILVIISGVGYVADSSCYFLLERPVYVTIGPILRSAFGGFMLALIWFMIKGIRVPGGSYHEKHLITEADTLI